MKSGIYKIENIATGMAYIGSSQDIKYRWAQHKGKLARGVHSNVYLQRSFKKHGESKFRFSIIEYCDEDDLLNVEQRYFDNYIILGLWDDLYNMTMVAGGGAQHALSDDEALTIREEHSKGGKGIIQLATEYELSRVTISALVNGYSYHHVGGPIQHEDYYHVTRTHAKVCEELVKEIRIAYAHGGVSQQELSSIYNMKQPAIGSIIRGETWKDIGGPIKGVDYGAPKGSLTEFNVIEIRNLYYSKVFYQKQIAKEFGISESFVSLITSGKRYKTTRGPLKGVKV